MNWTDEQLSLKNAISKWSNALSRDYLISEKKSEFSYEKWELIKEMGILALPIDSKYGGLNQDILTTMLVLQELGRCNEDAGLNFITASHIVSTEVPLQNFGTRNQKNKYLPLLCNGDKIGAHAITEPDSGSDAFKMRTRAIKKENHYILNGNKVFVSNGPIADLFVIYACTKKNRGVLGGYSAFLLERTTPGLTIGSPIEKMGLRTAPLCEVYFDDCKIQANQLLGREGQGFTIFNFVMKWEVLCSFAIHIGEMERLISKCIEYSKLRMQFGKAISKFQAISHKIADMKIGLESSRALLYRAAEKMLHGKNTTLDIAIAKVISSEKYVESAMDAIQIFGAYGYMHESGIEQYLRNAIGSKIYSGTSEIQRNTIASMMGL